MRCVVGLTRKALLRRTRRDFFSAPAVQGTDQTRVIGEWLVQVKSRFAELTVEMKIKDAVMQEKERLIQLKDAALQDKNLTSPRTLSSSRKTQKHATFMLMCGG